MDWEIPPGKALGGTEPPSLAGGRSLLGQVDWEIPPGKALGGTEPPSLAGGRSLLGQVDWEISPEKALNDIRLSTLGRRMISPRTDRLGSIF